MPEHQRTLEQPTSMRVPARREPPSVPVLRALAQRPSAWEPQAWQLPV